MYAWTELPESVWFGRAGHISETTLDLPVFILNPASMLSLGQIPRRYRYWSPILVVRAFQTCLGRLLVQRMNRACEVLNCTLYDIGIQKKKKWRMLSLCLWGLPPRFLWRSLVSTVSVERCGGPTAGSKQLWREHSFPPNIDWCISPVNAVVSPISS